MSDVKSLQICHCGWSNVTTYRGLRIHQGKKGCTPKVTQIPKHTQQIIFNTYIPKMTYAPGLPPDDFMLRRIMDAAKETESFPKDLSFPNLSSLLEVSPSDQLFETETLQMLSLPPAADMNPPPLFGSQRKAVIEAPVQQPLFGTAQRPLQLFENGSKTRHALDSMIGQPQPQQTSQTAAVADVVMDGKENKPGFGAISASTFHFAPSPSQNIFTQTKQPESLNVFAATSGVSSMDSGFGGTAPPFSAFSNNNQTQGAFGWPHGGLQFSSLVSGSFDTQTTAALNMPQMDQTGSSLLENLLVSDASVQVTNSGPSLATTDASVNAEIRPDIPQLQQKFGFPQTQLPPSPSAGAQGAMSQTPSSSQPGPKPSGVKENQHTGFGGTAPPFSAFSNNNQSQGAFGSPRGLQFSSPRSGSFDAQTTAVYNMPQMAPVQVTNSGPSLATTETSVNAEIRPVSGASQNIFGPNKHQPEARNAFTAASGGSSVRQNIPQLQQKFGFPQTQLPPSPSAGAQGAMSQTPSSSQPGPKPSGVKENQHTVTPPTASTTGAPQNGQRESQSGPATPKAPPQHEHKSYFETPKQKSDQSAAEANRTRRALDFSTGGAQAQTSLAVPTTTTQTIVPPVEEQNEVEKQQQLLRDKIKAELQQKIRCRDQKLCDIRASVKACEGSLDEEWLKIDTVFSNVIHLVEEARQRALQPIENRRQKLKKDSNGLIEKIQEDIVKLENDIKEVDAAADLEAVPFSKLMVKNFKTRNVDTDFAFGTLQTTISTTMEQIQEEMDKLTALELERAPAFAVDVKLDHSSAHQWLAVSQDGKTVQDSGQCQPQLPISRKRFELYGSIVGASSFSFGRAYWEVQVGAKTGWDLGVASTKANRKGMLTLSPDCGYWVLVHFEGKEYAAMTAPPLRVELKHKPKTVGVFLDHDEGLVSFYDVTNQTHIYSFTNCDFNDGILPYFSPHPKQNGKNAEPLVITKLKN